MDEKHPQGINLIKTEGVSTPSSPHSAVSYWTPAKDELLVLRRTEGFDWNDIANSFPGRSAPDCWVRFEELAQRAKEVDEKVLLARLYHR